MGVVFDAVDQVLGRPVAIKVTPGDRSDRARSEREAVAVAQIDSPYVVRVHEAGGLDYGGMYVVMERLDGESLEARLARTGPLALDEAISVVRDVLAGLVAAHAHGVVHRDVKPANVMLVPDAAGGARAKVLDFGLARVDGSARLTATGDIVGSPAFMAPEQIRGEGTDARTDLWAVGVLVHALLTGSSPFEAGSVAATLVRVLQQRPASLVSSRPEVPAELDALVASCLEKDRARRPASAASLVAALNGALDVAPRREPPGPRPSPRATKPRRASRNPLLLGLASALAVFVPSSVLLVVLGWPHLSPPRRPDAGPADAASTVDLAFARAAADAGDRADAGGSSTAPPAAGLAEAGAGRPKMAGIRPYGRGDPRSRACRCIGPRNATALCVLGEAPTCWCVENGTMASLCPSAVQACDLSRSRTRLAEGSPCSGYRGPAEVGLRPGTVECSHCDLLAEYVGPTDGAPCSGVEVGGKRIEDARWYCGDR